MAPSATTAKTVATMDVDEVSIATNTTVKGAVADGKHKIKKLTADKIRENLEQITRKNGEVDLTGHGIETIISLDGLQHTTKLNLSHNKITKLSDMKRVQNLTMLKLIDNKLNGEGLTELQHLKKLVILNVAENHVARIPVEVLRNMRTLKALVLNSNSITTLEWLPKFPELNSLIVSHNRISQLLPRTLERLPALTKISISHNQLEEIPDLSALTGLTELRLSHNKLTKVPFSLAKLKNLRVLELGHNAIDDWAGIEALGRLENLKQLSLSGNPIVGQPLPVVANATKAKKNKTKVATSKAKKAKKADASSDSDNSDDDGSSSDNDDDDDANNSSSSEDDEPEDILTEAETQARKDAKRLDAKHKQYNFKMKRIFPKLVIRDGQRILDKKTHGYVAPPKDDKPKDEKRKRDSAKRKHKGDKADAVDSKAARSEPQQKKHKDNKGVAVTVNVAVDASPAKPLLPSTPAAALPIDSTTDDKKDKKDKKKDIKDKKDKKDKKKGLKDIKKDLKEIKKDLKNIKKDSKNNEDIDEADKKNNKDNKKDKKKDSKKDSKKDKKASKEADKRKPKELASGVLAVKQFKKPKQDKSSAVKAVDISKVDFTPSVGMGGSSAWD